MEKDRIQSTISNGINTLKNSYEEGMNKVQQSQELSQWNRKKQKTLEMKSELLSQFGIIAYQLWRNKGIEDQVLNSIAEKLKGTDLELSEITKSINQLSNHNKGVFCECGANITESSRFCGSCGKDLSEKLKVVDESLINCISCESLITESSHYCSCCGWQVKQTVKGGL